jgi:hypothetical protein
LDFYRRCINLSILHRYFYKQDPKKRKITRKYKTPIHPPRRFDLIPVILAVDRTPYVVFIFSVWMRASRTKVAEH